MKTGDTLRMGETTLRVEIPVKLVEPDATIPPETPEAEPDVKIEGKLDANVPVAMPVSAVPNPTPGNMKRPYGLRGKCRWL